MRPPAAIINTMSAGQERVRILRLIARMNLGGPAHHVAILSAGLEPERYETLLVTGDVGRGEEELPGMEPSLRRLASLGPEIRPDRDIRALIELIRLTRSYRPAIVHTHTAKAGLLGRVAALFARRPRPLIVHTYHGHVLRGYFGPLRSRAFTLLERWLARGSDRLIGVSQATVDELVELGVAPRSRFTVVPLGLDLEPFLRLDSDVNPEARATLGVEPGDVLFTYTGRLVPIKRPDLMLRAVAQARGGGAPVKVAVTGDGGLRRGLESLAHDLGLANAVSFLGYRRDLPWIAGASDAALLTSDNEGTPVALIEAAAAARPAVATAVGGVAEIVVEGGGLLAAPGDVGEIARHISSLAADAEQRRRMGIRARTHVAERFSAKRLLSDVDSLYSGLLASEGERT
jgi:glycosyltransferase involved in cell wall biosynthesis